MKYTVLKLCFKLGTFWTSDERFNYSAATPLSESQRFTPSCCSANNNALKAKRKTINTADVMSAIDEMEFADFIEPLKTALEGEIDIKPDRCMSR